MKRTRENYVPRKDRVKRPRTGAKMRTTFKRPLKQGEVKGVDQLLTLSPIVSTTTTNGSIQVMNLVPPGSASYNRVGRKTYAKSLRLKGQIDAVITSVAASSDLECGIVRMVVVWDKQPSGVLPAFSDIFGYTDQAGTELATYLSPPRYDNMDRFKVLKDCTFEFKPKAISPNAGDNYTDRIAFDEYVKLGERESLYSGQNATQTIADISTGALYVVWRANQNVAGTFSAAVSSTSVARFRYTD